MTKKQKIITQTKDRATPLQKRENPENLPKKEDAGKTLAQIFHATPLPEKHLAQWLNTFKPENIPFALRLFHEAGLTGNRDGPEKLIDSEFTLAILNAVKPQDELEDVLATQMAGVHNLAMRLLAMAKEGQSLEPCIDMATKLLKVFSAQMESLNRYRGKGNQRVVVEHVTVNQGGQAIVGTIENRPQGGGGIDGK